MRYWTALLSLSILVVLAIAGLDKLTRHESGKSPPGQIAEVRRSLPARLAARNVRKGQPVYVRIFKEEAALELWMKGGGGWRLFETYPICRYSGRLGPKLREGDRQAPEGFYQVALGQLNPASRHHLSLNLGFPNRYDRAHGRTGTFLMIHGGCSSSGCYAMTDAAIDDIYGLVEAALRGGQSAVDVRIFPFRMTDRNLARHARSRWMTFWRTLKPAHDIFEASREVPPVSVRDKAYVVGS